MRKLKLQMQVTVDGYVAGPEGQLDWMTFDFDPALEAFVNQLTDTSDTILLGRKMTEGFIQYWEHVPKDSREYAFAQKMVGMPKVVFSKTLHHVEGKNVRVENGDLAEAVKQLKSAPGKDIVVYGGADAGVLADRTWAHRRDQSLRQPGGDWKRHAGLQGENVAEAGSLHGLPVWHRGEHLPAEVADAETLLPWPTQPIAFAAFVSSTSPGAS